MADKELTILVVDDSDINLKITVTMLKSLNYKVISTMAPESVVDIVDRKRPDLILMDYLMPGMNGTEVASLIRGKSLNPKDYFAEVPIIALTAEDIPEQRKVFFESGMNEVLLKPLTLEALNTIFSRFLPEASAIPGIDAVAAAALMGSKDMSEFFAMFIEDTAGKVKRITEAQKAGDYEAYTVDVHRLKSEAKMIGATVLSDLARELELVGKALTGVVDNGSTERQNKLTISEKTQPMLNNLIELSANIKKYLDSQTFEENSADSQADAQEPFESTESAAQPESVKDAIKSLASTLTKDISEAVNASKERARARSLETQEARRLEEETKAAENAQKPKNPKEEKIIRYIGYAKDALAKGDQALVKNWLDEILEVINDA